MQEKLYFVCASLVLILLVAIGNSEAQIDPQFIVGIWTLDEGDGDIAGDSSGNERDGTIQGAEWDNGKFGDGLNFAKGDTVVVPLGEGVITNELTVILWLQFSDLTGQQNYFSIWDNSDNRYVPYKTNGHELHFWSNNWDIASGVFVDDETWYHVANVYDGNEAKIYVNGELKISQPGAFTLSENDQQSSWFATDKGGWISACLEDDIGIFSTALSENEVKNIMEHGVIWALSGASVEPSRKISVTWGGIKHD